MTNRKRTTLISVLIIALCLSVCIGATYAYFTDSVESTGNKIQAGTLKVDLELLTDDTWNSIKESKAPVFNYTLWEPGFTDVQFLKVENEGNLAIKWEAKIVSDEALTGLADYIEVYVLNNGENEIADPENLEAITSGWTSAGMLSEFATTAQAYLNGNLLAATDATPTCAYIAIALHLPTDIGGEDVDDNLYQGAELPSFDIQILATQLNSETDFFSPDYDKIPCDHSVTEVIEGYAATYEEAGLTDGEKCLVCGETFIEQEEIPMLDDLVFTLRADGQSYSVKAANTLTNTEVVIPATYNGLPVTEIEDYAFFFLEITNIKIPDSVTNIDSGAFNYCERLTSIDIPDGVTCIDSGTFLGCKSLTSITIPDSVTSIGSEAFYECSSLTSIDIPDGVTSIGDRVFYDCSSLTSIDIPDGVTSIGSGAFQYCEHLTSIDIPDGVTSIDTFAFYGCSRLTSITIPDGVASISSFAFSCCPKLTSITIPNGVTSISHYAFSNSSALTSIKIPDSVTSIGSCAFSKCYSLNIEYGGTMEQWVDIELQEGWNQLGYDEEEDYYFYLTEIVCSDGTLTVEPSEYEY